MSFLAICYHGKKRHKTRLGIKNFGKGFTSPYKNPSIPIRSPNSNNILDYQCRPNKLYLSGIFLVESTKCRFPRL